MTADTGSESDREVEHTECALCGYEPDPDRIPPHYVLSLDEEDISEDTVESYPFGGSLSVPFACSDGCWSDAREKGLDRFRDSDGELVTDGGRDGHGDRADRHPHKPTPMVVDEHGNDLYLKESGMRSRQTVVEAEDRPLYDLLMEVLHEADAHCPDLMPAALAERCIHLLHVREVVTNIDRGSSIIGGVGYGMSYCYAVRDAIDEWRDREPITLVVAGCSASKHDVDEPVPACELYRGAYWTCKRDYGQTIGDEWRILSAKHGITDPNELIAHYDQSVEDIEGVPVHADSDFRLPNGRRVQTFLDRWAVNVYEGIRRWLIFAGSHGSIDPRDVELEVLLGRSYRDPLEERGVFNRLRGRGALEIAFPFQEVEQAAGGNGNQMGWMTDEVEDATAVATDGGESA